MKNFAFTSGVTNAVVTDVLPAGVALVSTKVNRGPGCTGTTTLTCDLAFLSGELVGTIEIVVRVTTAGTLVNTATVKAPEPDPDLSNNTASVTVGQPQPQPQQPPTPPKPPVAVVKPVLGKPLTLPATALAGKRFVFTLAVKRSDTGAPLTTGRMVANPTVAGKLVKHVESFKAGKVRLTFVVPKTAKGKLLKIKIKITASGKTTTRLYTYKVR